MNSIFACENSSPVCDCHENEDFDNLWKSGPQIIKNEGTCVEIAPINQLDSCMREAGGTFHVLRKNQEQIEKKYSKH